MRVELGKIVGVWGVKGWVKLHSYTRNRADIANYASWTLQDNRKKQNSNHIAQTYKVIACREQGKGIVAQLEKIDSREQAERLINLSIYVDQHELPRLPDGEFYWHQLIGLSVTNTDGLSIGKVTSILETGANDVLVVTPSAVSDDNQAKSDVAEVLVPYVDERILDVDLSAGTMLVDWDPDFLIDNS